MGAKISKKEYQKYMLIGLSLITLYFAYKIVLPFMIAILTSAVIAIAIYPFFERVEKKFKNTSTASAVTVVAVVIIVIVPLIILLNMFVNQSWTAYLSFKKTVISGQLLRSACTLGFFCELSEDLQDITQENEFKYYLQSLGDRVQSAVFNYSSELILDLPNKLLQLFFFVLFLYYFLLDGSRILKFIKELLPLNAKHQDHLIKKTNDTIHAVIYGQVLTAFVQGALGAIIFAMLGITSPVFWGAVMMIFAILPIGTWVIWLPAALNLILTGVAWETNALIWKGVILLILGTGFISTIDNIIKPYMITKKIKLNFGLVMIGLFGGLYWFGFVGLVIGPLVLTLLIAAFDIYQEMKHEAKK